MRLTGVGHGAAMHGSNTPLLFAATLLGLAGGIAIHARGTGQAPAADQRLLHEDRTRLLALISVFARAVNGRLRDKTEEERRAVTLYISSLMKTKDSEEKAPPQPSSLDILRISSPRSLRGLLPHPSECRTRTRRT